MTAATLKLLHVHAGLMLPHSVMKERSVEISLVFGQGKIS